MTTFVISCLERMKNKMTELPSLKVYPFPLMCIILKFLKFRAYVQICLPLSGYLTLIAEMLEAVWVNILSLLCKCRQILKNDT